MAVCVSVAVFFCVAKGNRKEHATPMYVLGCGCGCQNKWDPMLVGR